MSAAVLRWEFRTPEVLVSPYLLPAHLLPQIVERFGPPPDNGAMLRVGNDGQSNIVLGWVASTDGEPPPRIVVVGGLP